MRMIMTREEWNETDEEGLKRKRIVRTIMRKKIERKD